MPSQNVTPGQLNLFQRIWYSIFPDTHKTRDERRRCWGWLNTLVLHFRPKVVQERTLRFTLTWGMCGIQNKAVDALTFTTVFHERSWRDEEAHLREA
jgi:hypothetical protein